MIKQHASCGWSGPAPSGQDTGACAACGLARSRREVQRCQISGPVVGTQSPKARLIRTNATAKAPGACCGRSEVAVSRPSIVKQGLSYATAMAKFVGDGLQTRSETEQAENLSICGGCPLLGADGKCDGCGCVVADKVKMRLEECPASRWLADLHPVKPLVSPVRNLIYHLMPTTLHDGWKRNLEELARRWHVFNGRRYLSVVTSTGGKKNSRNGTELQTVPSLQVMEYCESLGMEWTEVRQVANNGALGEVVSFPWMLKEVMNNNQNEITFYAHGKGTTRPVEPTIERWRDAMYRYCLDDIASVDRALERFSCAASLLRFDSMSYHGWHPSGTFFWFRNADLWAKNWTKIQQTYHGVEAYIGDHFERHEVAALAHGDVGNMYVSAEWGKHQRAIEVWDAARAITPVIEDSTPKPPPKVIALYLPAFHREPLNDAAWGVGWTEWDNLRRWRTDRPGHTIQRPHGDIGEYDLLGTAARRKQAELARAYGVYGFAVYHYWFNGVKALNQPYEQMLLDGEPDLPFCFVWANEPWTKRWDGRDKEVIQSQTYGGREEWQAHAEYLRRFVEHKNYIRIDGERVLGIYRPGTIPYLTERLAYYREVLGDDLHFTTLFGTFGPEQVPSNYPILDSAIEFAPHANTGGWNDFALHPHQRLFRGASPGFDNTPRRGSLGSISNVPPFAEQLQQLRGEDYVFVNAWNEWGEQAVIEPSDRDGYKRLEEIRAVARPD